MTGKRKKMDKSEKDIEKNRADTGSAAEEKAEDTRQDTPENTADSSEEINEASESEKGGEEGPSEKAEPEKKEEEDLQLKYLRLAADFQNYRRHNDSARSEAYSNAKADLIKELLPVLDNFDRALANPTEDKKYAEGVELIHKTLLSLLEKEGLTEIEALGKTFDPNFHNAVMRQAAEGAESDSIINVFQKGYMLNGKVIRPSMVAVAE